MASARKQLAEYRRKRDFTRTAEPSGDAPAPRSRALRFVVQKHAASHLHFDFRLEIDGTMKSWAVPKGPSLDPAVRRLAMEVEDHPISYNTFEGTIPQGEYGGGTVMLWDRGTYEAAEGGEGALRRGHEAGRLDLVMHGERLEGGWTLVRTRPAESGKAQWLLMKKKDEHARPGSDIVAETMTSIASGRTMEEIGGKKGTGNREQGTASAAKKSATRKGAVAKVPAKKAAAKKTVAKKSAAKKKTVAKKKTRAAVAMPPVDAKTRKVLEQLEAIEQGGGEGVVAIGGARLKLSSLDKVFFPGDGFTKGDVARYYARMAKYVLPVAADRPMVLRRLPNGIEGTTFFQHRVENAPAGVRTEELSVDGPPEPHLVGGDLATLLYAVQLGAVSVDPWHSRESDLTSADYTILDLDPGPRATFASVVEVAREVKAQLDALGLRGALKTSGSRGLHVYVPLPTGTSNETALLVAQIVATRVAEALPKIATIERSVKARPAKAVYVDYLQNILGKSVAGAYSVRAKPGATVSCPLAWDELTDDLDPHAFTIETMPARVAEVGDLWTPAMKRRNTPATLARLAKR